MEDYLPEKTCRTCLQKSEELTSLHSKNDDTGLTLLEKLRFCASMQVVVSERMPSNACARCVRCIAEYYDFKQRCELSEKTLEDLCSKPSTYTATKNVVNQGEEEGLEDLCSKPSTYTATKIVVDNGEEEGADSAESDILDLFCDDDSKSTPCIDGKEEVDGKKSTPTDLDGRKKESKHPCDMCSSSFTTAESQQRHKKFCHSENRHRCDRCGATFLSAPRLRLHVKIHKHFPKYICETCGKSYALDSSLRIHIKENHTAELKVYECKVCGKTYNFLSSLNAHKRLHMPVDARCICDQCGRPFQNRHRLRQHIRGTHEKPFACDICDKRFGYKPDMQKHKAHHKKVMAKPYGCKLCDKRFSTTAAVAFHERTLHGGKKHLKCDVCGMEFYNRFHLAAHYGGHTGVKPYQCDGCGMGYNYNSTLMQHKKKCASLLALAQQ